MESLPAATFEEIRDAGEKFGKLFSREAAQAFAMIVMALLTHTAKGFAEQVATLPGSAQVSMQAAGREGSVALAPGAVAMAARGGRGDRTENHHIGTIANKQSSLRGGPWTPRLEDLYARAGMRMKDRENIVPIPGHKGPWCPRWMSSPS